MVYEKEIWLRLSHVRDGTLPQHHFEVPVFSQSINQYKERTEWSQIFSNNTSKRSNRGRMAVCKIANKRGSHPILLSLPSTRLSIITKNQNIAISKSAISSATWLAVDFDATAIRQRFDFRTKCYDVQQNTRPATKHVDARHDRMLISCSTKPDSVMVVGWGVRIGTSWLGTPSVMLVRSLIGWMSEVPCLARGVGES